MVYGTVYGIYLKYSLFVTGKADAPKETTNSCSSLNRMHILHLKRNVPQYYDAIDVSTVDGISGDDTLKRK